MCHRLYRGKPRPTWREALLVDAENVEIVEGKLGWIDYRRLLTETKNYRRPFAALYKPQKRITAAAETYYLDLPVKLRRCVKGDVDNYVFEDAIYSAMFRRCGVVRFIGADRDVILSTIRILHRLGVYVIVLGHKKIASKGIIITQKRADLNSEKRPLFFLPFIALRIYAR